MRKLKIILIWVFLGLALVGATWFKLSQPRILVLHSYSRDYSWTRDIDSGLKRSLDAKLGYKVHWHYMDTKNHPEKQFKQNAGAIARRAIESLNPALIIAVDDDAQLYAAQAFAGKPGISIIFAGINGSVQAYGYGKAGNVTGIYERKPLTDLRTALLDMRLAGGVPLGRRVMQLGDRSDSVLTDSNAIEAFEWAPFRIVDSVATGSFDEWKKAVLGAKGKADLILVSNYRNVYETAAMKKLVAPADLMNWTEANSPVPVVGIGGFMVEDGGMFALGASGFEQGEVAARMAIQVLSGGVTPKDIPQVMPRQYLVYARHPLMAKRGISLPPLYEAFARATNNYYE